MKKLLSIIGLCSFINLAMADTILPAGSVIGAKFISGAALSKGTTPENPIPVLLQITNSNILNCKAFVSAVPDFASNRARVQISKFSCNGKDLPIKAYVVGVDGKFGIPNMGTVKDVISITPDTVAKIITMNAVNIESY